jgi:hypothetical protein
MKGESDMRMSVAGKSIVSFLLIRSKRTPVINIDKIMNR